MIIDASVAFKWIIEEPGSQAAIDWIGKADLLAPTLIHAEVGNALWKRVRKGEIEPDLELADRLSELKTYVRTLDETADMVRALQIAIELNHPVYDCVYLAMAERLADRLLTADGRFVRSLRSTSYAERVEELSS
jgi:predicted nucleic acid-binding protein